MIAPDNHRDVRRIGYIAGAVIIAVAALWVPPQAHAHVPPECGPLFTKAGKEFEIINRKMQEASDMAMDGLDPGWQRRYPYGRYERLADLVAQVMGAMTFGYMALNDAITCVHPAAHDAQRKERGHD